MQESYICLFCFSHTHTQHIHTYIQERMHAHMQTCMLAYSVSLGDLVLVSLHRGRCFRSCGRELIINQRSCEVLLNVNARFLYIVVLFAPPTRWDCALFQRGLLINVLLQCWLTCPYDFFMFLSCLPHRRAGTALYSRGVY